VTDVESVEVTDGDDAAGKIGQILQMANEFHLLPGPLDQTAIITNFPREDG
jgi:hypothetical protein